MVTWNHEQPIFHYVRELIGKKAPEVGINYNKTHPHTRHPTYGVGGFNNRTNRRGGFSRHSEGRACDIYVNVNDSYLRALGDALFKGLAKHARSLGVEDLLWDDQAWSHVTPHVHRNPDIDSLLDHQDHLHVGFSRAMSQQKPRILEQIISDAVQEAKLSMPHYVHAPRGFRSE